MLFSSLFLFFLSFHFFVLRVAVKQNIYRYVWIICRGVAYVLRSDAALFDKTVLPMSMIRSRIFWQTGSESVAAALNLSFSARSSSILGS